MCLCVVVCGWVAVCMHDCVCVPVCGCVCGVFECGCVCVCWWLCVCLCGCMACVLSGSRVQQGLSLCWLVGWLSVWLCGGAGAALVQNC